MSGRSVNASEVDASPNLRKRAKSSSSSTPKMAAQEQSVNSNASLVTPKKSVQKRSVSSHATRPSSRRRSSPSSLISSVSTPAWKRRAVDSALPEHIRRSPRTPSLARKPPIAISTFATWLNAAIEAEYGGWETLERSKQITDGNTVLKAAHVKSSSAWSLAAKSMLKAQYGRARCSFVSQAMAAVEARADDTFVDIGSGIGSVVFQVAATIGCRKVYGIELCAGRNDVALSLKPRFDEFIAKNGSGGNVINFFQGDFREPSHFALCREADIIFVNNAESVFGARSVGPSSYTLDWHVARAACGMRDGARIVCFEALVELEQRQLQLSFERQDHESEKGATSWTETSGKRTRFYSYRKLKNSWTCSHCSMENPLLRESSNEWGQSFQEACLTCQNDPAGLRRSYPTRGRSRRQKSPNKG